jgi:hypothetical protein
MFMSTTPRRFDEASTQKTSLRISAHPGEAERRRLPTMKER